MSTVSITQYNSHFDMLHVSSRIDMQYNWELNPNHTNLAEPEVPTYVNPSTPGTHEYKQGTSFTDSDGHTWVLDDIVNGAEKQTNKTSFGLERC